MNEKRRRDRSDERTESILILLYLKTGMHYDLHRVKGVIGTDLCNNRDPCHGTHWSNKETSRSSKKAGNGNRIDLLRPVFFMSTS